MYSVQFIQICTRDLQGTSNYQRALQTHDTTVRVCNRMNLHDEVESALNCPQHFRIVFRIYLLRLSECTCEHTSTSPKPSANLHLYTENVWQTGFDSSVSESLWFWLSSTSHIPLSTCSSQNWFRKSWNTALYGKVKTSLLQGVFSTDLVRKAATIPPSTTGTA